MATDTRKKAPAQAKAADVRAKDAGARTHAHKGPKPSPLSRLRAAMPVIVVLVCSIAFMLNVPLGNLSSFGWESISASCPVGALSVMLADRALVPRAVVSLVIAVALILLFGRAFCGWICTVPLVQRTLGIRTASKADRRRDQHDRERRARKGRRGAGQAAAVAADAGPTMAAAVAETGAAADASPAPAAAAATAPAPLSAEERAQIKAELSGSISGGCGQHLLDSRYLVLGGGLLSALVFGFPVFCLLCPIGLSFASVYLVLRLFTGQFSWALVVVPVLLAAELLLFRRWCYRICPVSALLSLVSRGNRTFVPAVDTSKCVVTAKGRSCSACSTVCPEGINLHDFRKGELAANECLKCRACVDACPSKAITMPFLPPKGTLPHSAGFVPAHAAATACATPEQGARDTSGEGNA